MEKVEKYFSYYIYPLFGLFAVFSATFSSDFSLYGFPAFYLAWLAVVILRLMTGIKFKAFELITQFLLLFVFYFSLYPAVEDLGFYYNSYIFAVLYINVLFFIPFLFKRKITIYLCFYSLVFFSAMAIGSILSGAIRSYIIFGPNVLYRIYAFLFFMMLITHAFHSKKKIYKSVMVLIAFLALMIATAATGSRGAMVVFFLISIIIIFNFSFFFKKSSLDFFFLGILCTAIVSIIIVYIDYFSLLFWRLFYFDPANNSEFQRLNFFKNSLEFLMNEKGLDLMYGVGHENNYFYYYPHNIFIESMVYGGLNLLFVSLITSFAIFWTTTFSKDRMLRGISFLLIGIFFGSLVSGSLLYNFPVFSVGWLVIIIGIHKTLVKIPVFHEVRKKLFVSV